jgi:aminoglycoside phosphotransferase (APT) family kinase protein
MNLMSDLASLVMALLGEELHALQLLGEGSDHFAYEVNHAFVLRLRKPTDEPAADAIEREAALLAFASEVSPIPVPSVIATDAARGALLLTKLPGISLFERPSLHPQTLVAPLSAFISALHSVPVSRVLGIAEPDNPGMGACRAEAERAWPVVAAILSHDCRHVVESFLRAPLPPEPHRLTFCHNDLGAEHLLATSDGTALTGVIDWSDATVADPARDLGLILRDLGPVVADAIATRTHAADDHAFMARAVFYARCALIEDLAYGLRTASRPYVAHALNTFWRTFT